MASRFKLRLSQFLRVCLGFSCLPRRNQTFHAIRSIRRRESLFPSICQPGSSEMSPAVVSYWDDKFEFPICGSLEMRSPFLSGNMDGRTCPPASPFSPETTEFLELNHRRRKKQTLSSVREEYDDREEEKNKFSISKNFSSDSGDSRRTKKRVRRKMSTNRSSDVMGLLPKQGNGGDSLAVVKESSDPYNDFRTSMVEMIVENKMSSPKDLEQLLDCFLSLNPHRHHGIIVQVFSEIWEGLFQSAVLDNKTTNKSKPRSSSAVRI